MSILGLTCLAASCLVAAEGAATETSLIELRGQLVPVPSPVTNATFRTENGTLYTLVSNRLSSALFLDTNLQSKILLLGGRVLPGTRMIEVTRKLRAIHGGKIHELAYYCDVCSITSTESGECMCCREPVRLVEEPESELSKPKSK